MARKQSRVPIFSLPQMADDFKLISGIGPAIAGRLHDAGIRTYNQLASLSPTKLATRIIGLSAKQIARQDWSGQARKLAYKKARPNPHTKKKVMATIRQHYENFTIEFLLDEKNVTRRTRVVHIQSGDADTWAGWEAEQLIHFLARHTEVRRPAIKLAPQEIAVASREALQNVNGESSPMVISTPNSDPLFSAVTKLAQPGTEIADPFLQSSPTVDLAGTLRLRDLNVLLIDSDLPIFFLHQGELCRLQLTLNLTEVVAPSDAPLIYRVTTIFKQLGGPLHCISEASSTLKLSDSATLGIAGPSLPPGIYRLDAFVRLTCDEEAPGLAAFLKGDLLQVC